MANKVLDLTTLVADIQTDPEVLYTYADLSMTSNGDKIAKLTDYKAIGSSLKNIFSFIPGQRILDPEFGSDIYRYIYDGITEASKEKIQAAVYSAISKYEPRIKIVEITYDQMTTDDIDHNTVKLIVYYEIPSLNVYKQSYTLLYDSRYSSVNDN